MSSSTIIANNDIDPNLTLKISNSHEDDVKLMICKCWEKLAPFWPLKEFVAVNPLQGLENMPIEEAMVEAAGFFQQDNIPEMMSAVNRETIKWCQAFFDEGQATISMPNRDLGLYKSWKKLAVWDEKLHENDKYKMALLENLPENPEETVTQFLSHLEIPNEDRTLFLTLLLTTLPGWAAHVKYRNECQHPYHPFKYSASQTDYLAMRIVIIAIMWPQAQKLIAWHKLCLINVKKTPPVLQAIKKSEDEFHTPLLKALSSNIHLHNQKKETPDAQIAFCIDVRSEQIRRSIESVGNYETFGCAGFFGLPIAFEDPHKEEVRPSCPVIVKPKHVLKLDSHPCERSRRKREKIISSKSIYQHLKYNFMTSLALLEIMGGPAGVWMTLQNFFPRTSSRLKRWVINSNKNQNHSTSINVDIPFKDQCDYAEAILSMIGLKDNFAPLVIFCAHGSKTQNNAFASALECGACGGRNGTGNAKVICQILNRPEVRKHLASKGIEIDAETLFIAGEHNTTTNAIRLLLPDDVSGKTLENIHSLQEKLDASTDLCNSKLMGLDHLKETVSATKKAIYKSSDWAQTRPEWGLANNAAFIVGPRALTETIDMKGRTFLHSYDWRHDPNGESLASILYGPLVVGQWINSQYLFSSLDNVAYGSGSKVTKNITGKIGVIQGNGSDLMHGLPLQSVNQCDKTPFHTPCRLMSVIFAPLNNVEKAISSHPLLRNLIENRWIRLFCIQPSDLQTYQLKSNMQWEVLDEDLPIPD